jgi:MSHA pilin protein MshC
MSKASVRSSGGFTLTELIVVLVVVGILGAIGVGRFFKAGDYDVTRYANQARALIRYGQQAAIAQNRTVYVKVDGGRVALCFTIACAAADRIRAPGGSNSATTATKAACSNDDTWACEAWPASVTAALSPIAPYASNAWFSFDAQGRPVPAAASTQFIPLTFTFTAGSAQALVRVAPETGYVY